jgi:dipeptidyl-peptidase-4
MFASIISLVVFMQTTPVDPSLLTVAEQSDYTQTSTSAQVQELIERIHARSKVMQITDLGKTVEGKSIPLIILSNPEFKLPAPHAAGPATSVAHGRDRDHRPICFIMANIHAGEVEGKEACLMLAREIALNPDYALLNDLIVIIAPNYNADGNDKFDDVAKNRPGQDGPARCGVRPNAQGFDLNRDYIKLEAPESRALVKFLNDIDPDITIDCHTTNGSHHRYVLTYDAPLNPSGHPAPIDFVRNQLLPEVTKRVKANAGYDMWFYGNFNRDHTTWESYSAQPRFGGSYQGLRNQMTVLSEAYSYAPFKDRVIASREFIREILQFVAENKSKVIEINRRAREETARQGENPQPHDVVGIRHRMAAFNQSAIVKGYERAKGGEGGAATDPHMDLGAPKDYAVVHLGRFEPTLAVSRPHAYIIPPTPVSDTIIEKLKQHGIAVSEFTGEAVCDVYTVTAILCAQREFQMHREVKLDVESKRERRTILKGSFIVSTAQPLGTLAVYLLEPQSEDGLVTWNFFDDVIETGEEFPILRVRSNDDIAPN